jgi:hypothetical protein
MLLYCHINLRDRHQHFHLCVIAVIGIKRFQSCKMELSDDKRRPISIVQLDRTDEIFVRRPSGPKLSSFSPASVRLSTCPDSVSHSPTAAIRPTTSKSSLTSVIGSLVLLADLSEQHEALIQAGNDRRECENLTSRHNCMLYAVGYFATCSISQYICLSAYF